MAVKTTGAEFKRFYNDEVFWPEGTYHDDMVILVDGVKWDDFQGYDAVPDASPMRIESGFVRDDNGEDMGSFEGYFKKWRKAQSTASFVVECDKPKLDAVKAAIKAAGGRVV